jgi:hypothetical protein
MTDLSFEEIKEREQYYAEQDEGKRRQRFQSALSNIQNQFGNRPPQPVRQPPSQGLPPSRGPARAQGTPGTQLSPPSPGLPPGRQLPPSRLPLSQSQPLGVSAQRRDLPSVPVSAQDAPVPSRGNPPVRPARNDLPADPIASAQHTLRFKFPGIAIKTPNAFEDEPKQLLEKRLGTLPNFITQLVGPFLSDEEKQGLKVVLLHETGEHLPGKGIQVKVEATVKPSGKEDAFRVNLIYLPADKGLALDIISTGATGEGKRFFKTVLLPQAGQLGITTMALDAASIGKTGAGVVAWARYGFIPRQKDWDTMTTKGLGILKNEKNKELEPFRKQLRAILKEKSPRALRKLVYLTWFERKRTGKRSPTADFLDRILGTSWIGDIDLNNPKDADWIKTYVATEKAEEQLETFEKLLD